MKKILVLALLLFVPAAIAYDETCGDGCADLPSCADLGYKQGLYCPEGYITCPFDQDYIWCKSYTCNMGGLYARADVAAKQEQGYKCRKVTYHGLECYNCDEVDERCRWNDANKGEGELSGNPCPNGNYPECIRKCAEKDKSAEIPTGDEVVAVKETCVSCGVPEVIVVDYTCVAGYVKTETGCEPSACETPTTNPEIAFEASNRIDCSDKAHPEGWIFETGGESGGLTCSRCIPKPCAQPGYVAGLTECANITGYNYLSDGFSGDETCGYCEALSCRAPYSTNYQSVDDCPTASLEGWSASKAWTYQQDTTGAGDLACGRCVAKTCSGGYSTDYQSLSDCPNQTGYTFSYSTTVYAGDKYCGKCVSSGSCTEGQTGLSAVGQCQNEPYNYPGIKGASIEETGYYNGSDACKKCVCNPTSECQWTSGTAGAHPIGTGGAGIGSVCCDGSYTGCENNTCEGALDVNNIEHATATTVCSACGHTYTKVTECDEGYKVSADGKSCIEKDCADYGLNGGTCSDGFKPVESMEHSGCYTCEAKVCEDYDMDWLLYSSGASCNEGYKLTQHPNQKLGNRTGICYDCLSCQTYSGYITVNSEADIPSYVTSHVGGKSCEKYQYCATACATGYEKIGCECVSASCEGYVAMTGLTKINDTTYTDGIFTYGVCNKAGENLFKTNGCTDDYPFSACDGSIGEQSAGGGSKDGYNCYKCECTAATPTLCPYTTNQSDTTKQYVGSGTASNECCDGSYKNCTKGNACSGFTLTSEPPHATSTQSCTACGETKYKAVCETGYKGDDCSECDEANGYYECNGECLLKPECENGGRPQCTDDGWKCQCVEGYTGDDCSECDEAHNYYMCGGECKLRCNQNPQCLDGEWQCECPEGYTGDDCSECDDGYMMCGGECKKIECENGSTPLCVRNQIVCNCGCCYQGSTCGESSGRCVGTTPNTCENNATGNSYSDECDESCSNCTDVSVSTCNSSGVTTTLSCFSSSAKNCSGFCGAYTLRPRVGYPRTEVVSDSYCSSGVSQSGGKVYSWLTSNSSSGVSVANGCGGTCYFDDTTCSAGQKMTASEREGLSCEIAGYTAAGSECYECTELNDECSSGLVREENKNSYGACSLIETTEAGTGCYECCPSGYGMLSSDTTCNNSVPANQTTRSSTNTHCCYAIDDCGSCNTVYDNLSACSNAVTVTYDSYTAFVGDCNICNNNGAIGWYPTCDDEHDSLPSGATYVNNGYYTCCLEWSGGTFSPEACDSSGLGEVCVRWLHLGSTSICTQWRQLQCEQNGELLPYEPVYAWNEVGAVQLGNKSCSDTCYIEPSCTSQSTSLCGSVTCTASLCSSSSYPYNASNKGNAELTGSSCTPISADCSVGETQYSGLSCNTTTYPYTSSTVPSHGTLTGVADSLCCTDSSNVKHCSDFLCESGTIKSDGTCKDCDALGYYAISGCPADRICQPRNVDGLMCKESAMCDESNGFYEYGVADCDAFECGQVNPYGVSANDTLECVSVGGCSHTHGYYETPEAVVAALGVPLNQVDMQEFMHPNGVDICYQGTAFSCDNSKGLFVTCPTGARCEYVNGCQHPIDCDISWVDTTEYSSYSNYFSFGSPVTIRTGTSSTITCRQVTGCSGYAGQATTEVTQTFTGNLYCLDKDGAGIQSNWPSRCLQTGPICFEPTGCQNSGALYNTGCPTGTTQSSIVTISTPAAPRPSQSCRTCACPDGQISQSEWESITEGREYLNVDVTDYSGFKCYEPLGCKNNSARNLSSVYDREYFTWKTYSYPNTDITCSVATGCASGYTQSDDAYPDVDDPAHYCGYGSGHIANRRNTSIHYAEIRPAYVTISNFACTECRDIACSDYYCECTSETCGGHKLVEWDDHSACTGSTKQYNCYRAEAYTVIANSISGYLFNLNGDPVVITGPGTCGCDRSQLLW